MGWKQYLGLEYVDYTDQLFQSLIRTRYAKRQFSMVLSLIIVGILKWHIKILFSCIIQIHPIVDFILQILLSVILAFKGYWIRNIVDRFKSEIYALSRYLINNYSPENLKVWKRNIVLLISLYFIIHILLIEITKWVLVGQILQFLISYFFIEGIEGGTFVEYYERMKKFFNNRLQSKGVIGTRLVDGPLRIQDDYLGLSRNEDEGCEGCEGCEELSKSWMIMDNVMVIEDSLDRSIVVFKD